VASFKPAYLIHGDDHGRIAERRARLRALAEKASGAQGVEVFEGERATADEVAGSLSMMTFALGRRFLIVDGVERWKDKDLGSLQAALAGIAPDTTVAFFAREDTRA
jgi:DNA polymerase-3 subunit delta